MYCTTFGPHTGRVSFKFDRSLNRETANSYNTPDQDNSDKIPKIFRQTTIEFPKKKVHSYSSQISNVRQMTIEFPHKKVHSCSSQISNVRQLNMIVQKMDDPFFGCF